jgi:hypothetical protein
MFDVINTYALTCAYVDCELLTSPADMLSSIQQQLYFAAVQLDQTLNASSAPFMAPQMATSSTAAETKKVVEPPNRCQSVLQLSQYLTQVKALQTTTSYIVLDHADGLIKTEITKKKHNLIAGLFRLSEMTQHRICVVLMGSAYWEELWEVTGYVY